MPGPGNRWPGLRGVSQSGYLGCLSNPGGDDANGRGKTYRRHRRRPVGARHQNGGQETHQLEYKALSRGISPEDLAEVDAETIAEVSRRLVAFSRKLRGASD